MDRDEYHTFVCPDCAESMTVDDGVRTALLEHGCAVCGAAVCRSTFTTQ